MNDRPAPAPGSAFSAHLGVEVESEGDGEAMIRAPFSPYLANTTGTVAHGGFLATMLDMAGGRAAATSGEGPRQLVVTVTMTITYLAPATTGPFCAVAKATGGGRRLVAATGEVLDANGRTLALMQGVWRKMGPGRET